MTQNDVYTEPPPLPSDIPLRIYSNLICPFAQRVRLIAAAKGIKTQEINIHLKVKPEWYVEKINPAGQVPTIEHEGKLIRESTIAFDYVDDVFGEGSIWPKDPYNKAKARLFTDDFGNKFIPNYYKHYGDELEEHTQALIKFLEKIEESFREETPVLGGLGGKPGAADLLVWPWLERLEALRILKSNLGSLITKDKFPLYTDYIARMKEDPAVKPSYLPPQAHLAFMKSSRNGVHDYSTADIDGTGVTIYTKKVD